MNRVVAATVAIWATCLSAQAHPGGGEPVGLSLFFRNGEMAPIRLIEGHQRYLQEIDLSTSVTTLTDEGIAPLMTSGEMAGLDWSGVTLVEELWNASLDGTFTRERYYRSAGWMESPSGFLVVPVDDVGRVQGAPLVAFAGADDRRTPADSAFIRRFNARQIALGCPSVGDCTGAVYIAEGLVQLRQAPHPERAARRIPTSATALKLYWTEDLSVERTVALEHVERDDVAYGYGFDVDVTPSPPANGSYYEPGETVLLKLTFRDGEGNRLHPDGSLPSYGEFFADQVESGLRYLDFLRVQTRLYYALKHREANLLVVLSGPTDKVRTGPNVVNPLTFFGPQVEFATVPTDGYSAVGAIVPPAGIVFGGLVDPSLWQLPTSDVVPLVIPADAQPGTWIAAAKARREYGGEALNRGATVELQVGTTVPTTYTPKVACNSCHAGPRTDFDTILHGISDFRSCYGCHQALGNELDLPIDIRVHAIHTRSDRYDADFGECTRCHLSQPAAPPRGVP